MTDTRISSAKAPPTDHQTPKAVDMSVLPVIERTGRGEAPVSAYVFETRGANAAARVIEIDRLYEHVPGTTSQMVRALELLKQASELLSKAQAAETPIEADNFAQRVAMLMPRLFALRSIGDGFGVIINSLHFAFLNLDGAPPSAEQLNVMWRVVRELRTRPAMPLEHGILSVEELEAHGLAVDAPELAGLLEDSGSASND